MRDDDAAALSPKGTNGPLPQRDPVVLPEHASAYYSPRPPPAQTAHDTMETEAVRLDPALDSVVPLGDRITMDELEPPPIEPALRVQTDEPTVLVPVMRARRNRRRLMAVVSAALLGSAGGIVYGLMRETPPPPPVLESGAAPTVHMAAPSVPAPRAEVVSAPAASAPVAATPSAPVVPPPSVARPRPVAAGIVSSKRQSRPAAGPTSPTASPREAAPSAWFKAERPKAWFK